jgi:MFS family permease
MVPLSHEYIQYNGAAEPPSVPCASFPLSFFIRPFGGIIFSHIGDLIGGEWGGALLLATEYAPPERRGFFGSIPQMGVTIGMVMGTLALWIMSLLPDQQFMTWGWRVPFIFSALLVVFGLWIRKGIDETPDFKKVQESGEIPKLPIVDTLRYYWKEVLITIGAKVVETAPFYIFSTFIVSYATSTLGFSRSAVLGAVMVSTVITTILIPIMGSLSDRVGRKKMYIAGTLAMMAFAFPYFWMIHQGSVLMLVLATIIGLGIIWAPITAVLGTMFSEIFDAKVRYTGVSLGYQIGAAVAGGTAPLVATALLASFDNSYVPVALYIMFTAVESLIAIWAVKSRVEPTVVTGKMSSAK